MTEQSVDDVDVSVYIITFEQEEYVEDAIESVLSQTKDPYEVIIADDNSRDGTRDILRAYADRHPKIELLLQDENVGISRNLNSALEAVSGDVVTGLGGDDRFLPQKLESETRTYLENPSARVVYSDFYFINPDGGRIKSHYEEMPPTGDVFVEIFGREFWFRNHLQDVESLDEIGCFDESLKMFADWDYTIRLTKHFDVAYTGKPLLEYRKHPDSITQKTDRSYTLERVQEVVEKNRYRLDSLSPDERLRVERNLRRYFDHQQAELELAEQNRLAALRYYMSYLARSSEGRRDVRKHMKFVLPRSVKRLVRRFLD